jgi:iron(III) transport system permease protein
MSYQPTRVTIAERQAPGVLEGLWVARAAHPPRTLVVLASAVGGLVLSPIAFTVWQACRVGASEAIALLVRPIVGGLLLNTIGIVLASSVACAIVGTATAWLVERTDLPGRNIWGVLAAAPLAIPPFITSYAWVSLSQSLQDFWGALLVVTCAYYPLVYLAVAAALRGLDPALEDVARSMGLGAWSRFYRVVLPQLRPALLGAVLLVALDTLVEFGAFGLLRFRTFTTELYAQYRTGLAGPESSLLAVVLLSLCLVFLILEMKVRGHVHYARVGAGAPRPKPCSALGRARLPAVLAFLVLTGTTLGVPVGMIVFWLLQRAEAATSPVVPSWPLLLSSLLSSVSYGLAGAIAALVLAAPLAFLVTRYPSRWSLILERTAFLALGVPGIVVALALVELTVQYLRPLYQGAVTLVLAYGILFLPLALVSIRASLTQAPRALEEQARSLGHSWLGAAYRVTLPLARPGIGAGAAMTFVFVATELTATLLLAPIGTRTLATEVWANTSSLAFAAAAPFAALMLAISLLATWLLARRFGTIALAGQA